MRNLFPFLGAAKRKTASPRSRLCAAVILGNIRANGVPTLAEWCRRLIMPLGTNAFISFTHP